MKKSALNILILIFLVIQKGLFAQENPAQSSYAFNPLILSPSFAGLNTGTLSFLQDFQFMGIKGAPKTTITTFDYGLVDLNLGLALDISNDKIGPISNSIVRLSTAYHLKVGRGETFSFGMRHNFFNINVDLAGERRIDQDDITVNENTISAFNYNLDLSGLYYSRKTYVGATILNTIRGRFLDSNWTARSFNVFLGSEYQYSRNIRFAYSGALIVEEGSPNTFNLYGQYFITPNLRVGIHSHARLIGFNTIFEAKGFRIFYKYSYPRIKGFRSYSNSVGLSFDFINEQTKIETPIFFLN
tara:strand:+ start:1211 stop:2110 length:900 start_codon:yes stop_codon:yes gene_type:complete